MKGLEIFEAIANDFDLYSIFNLFSIFSFKKREELSQKEAWNIFHGEHHSNFTLNHGFVLVLTDHTGRIWTLQVADHSHHLCRNQTNGESLLVTKLLNNMPKKQPRRKLVASRITNKLKKLFEAFLVSLLKSSEFLNWFVSPPNFWRRWTSLLDFLVI